MVMASQQGGLDPRHIARPRAVLRHIIRPRVVLRCLLLFGVSAAVYFIVTRRQDADNAYQGVSLASWLRPCTDNNMTGDCHKHQVKLSQPDPPALGHSEGIHTNSQTPGVSVPPATSVARGKCLDWCTSNKAQLEERCGWGACSACPGCSNRKAEAEVAEYSPKSPPAVSVPSAQASPDQNSWSDVLNMENPAEQTTVKQKPDSLPPPACGAILYGSEALQLAVGGDLCTPVCGAVDAQCQYAGTNCSAPPTPDECCRACEASDNCGSWFLNGNNNICYAKFPGAR